MEQDKSGPPAVGRKELDALHHAEPSEPEQIPDSTASAFAIVGIGASAGGLSAIEAFFSALPAEANTGISFVLIQHVAPDHKSILMMLGMSGMDLHQWLLKRNRALARQMVFITGGAFTPKASEYLRRAGNLKLEKPFDITNLKRLVSELILAAKSKRE